MNNPASISTFSSPIAPQASAVLAGLATPAASDVPVPGAIAPVIDFAALMQSLNLTGVPPALNAAELAVLEDVGDNAAESPVDALQALLAGLLGIAVPTTSTNAGGNQTPVTIPGKNAKLANGAVAAHALPQAPDLSAEDGGELPTAAANLPFDAKAAAAAAKLADSAADGGNNRGSDSVAGQLAAAGASPAQSARVANSHPAQAHVQSPVGTPAWSQELGQRMVWLAHNGLQTAQISLNPAHLGPIEIRLSLSTDQATAVFMSAHGEVREALEAALPRLREMLAGAGIELGQTHVNSQSQQQASADGRSAAGGDGRQRAILGGDSADNSGSVHALPLARGLIDTFA